MGLVYEGEGEDESEREHIEGNAERQRQRGIGRRRVNLLGIGDRADESRVREGEIERDAEDVERRDGVREGEDDLTALVDEPWASAPSPAI